MLAAVSGQAVVMKQAAAKQSVDRTVVAATKPKAKAPAKKVASVRGARAAPAREPAHRAAGSAEGAAKPSELHPRA